MKLVFLMQRDRWFVEHLAGWFRIDDAEQVDLALAVLPLEGVDEYELVEQPHQQGVAALERVAGESGEPDRVTVSLARPDGADAERHELAIDEARLVHVEWLNRRFRDGWVAADTRLLVDGMRSLVFEVYLPPADGADAKRLTVEDETGGSTHEVSLPRDARTRVTLVDGAFAGRRRLRLRCEPERITGSTDARQLGFLLLDERAEAA